MTTSDTEEPFNLDVKKTSRFRSNFWALSTLIILAIGGYGLYRDLRESDRTQFLQIVQDQREAMDRHQRQEKHFEFADSRLDALEKRTAATEALMGVIANDVGWVRRRIEYQDRQGGSK